MTKCILYVGFERNTEIKITATLKDAFDGYKVIPCIECGGSGWWGYGPTIDECGPCIVCKGTGKVFVNC